jgi:sugar-specific transcriptional regulator TrmB
MAKTKAKAEEVEEIEDDDVEELDDLDSDVEEDEAPKSKAKASTPAVTFGAADLAKHLSELTGKTISTRDLRTQIRRMARDGSNRVDREITAGNRTRYDWPKGLKDPEVKAIIKAVTDGELEAGKKEALDKLKADKAAKKAAKDKDAGKGKGKGKKAPIEDDDEDDDDE